MSGPGGPSAPVEGGVLLGVDVGQVRVGLAASDGIGLLAHPVETVRRDEELRTDLDRIAEEVRGRSAVAVVVGLPISLSGQEGSAASRARRYAVALQRRLEVPVLLRDERLSTVDAHRALRESGVPGRDQRGVVDQAAAVVILQSALDARRAGSPAGVPVKTRKPRTRRSAARDPKDAR